MANIETILSNINAEIETLDNPRQRNQLLLSILWNIHQKSINRMEFETALQRMLDRVDVLRDSDGEPQIDRRVGSIIYDSLAPVSAELWNTEIGMQIREEQAKLTRATGSNLDNKWGADNSLPRQPATRAIRIAHTFNREGVMMDFPVGIRFFEPDTTETIRYELLSTNGGRALLRATEPGARGNTYVGVVIPTQATNNLGRCEIIGTEIPGRDVELDNRYRQRLINHLARPMFGGNIWQYRKWFEESPPDVEVWGVGDTIIYPAWLGGSTSKVIVVDSGYNPITQDFLDHLQSIFDPFFETPSGSIVHGLGNGHYEKGLPIGHELTLATPNEDTIDITVEVVLRPNISIGQLQSIAETRIAEHIGDVRRDYVIEWEDAVLRGDAITLDDTIYTETNYVIGIHHSIGIFKASISAALIDTRLVANVLTVTITGENPQFVTANGDYVMLQDKHTHIIPKLGSVTLIPL